MTLPVPDVSSFSESGSFECFGDISHRLLLRNIIHLSFLFVLLSKTAYSLHYYSLGDPWRFSESWILSVHTLFFGGVLFLDLNERGYYYPYLRQLWNRWPSSLIPSTVTILVVSVLVYLHFWKYLDTIAALLLKVKLYNYSYSVTRCFINMVRRLGVCRILSFYEGEVDVTYNVTKFTNDYTIGIKRYKKYKYSISLKSM